jgi:outer membrane protein OmpA-like peptidoglycan-associated protein
MSIKQWLGSIVVVVIAIVGSGVAYAGPIASIQPQDFGSVRVANAATTTVSRTFDITNTGDTTLTINNNNGVIINGTNASDFTITSPPSSMTIPAAGSVQITVEFDPSAAGARTANLKLSSDATNSPTNTALTGTGTNAVISVTDVDFGNVSPGSNTLKSITISNTATTNQGPLHVASAALTGGSWFSFDTTGPSGCASATSCTLNVDVPPDATVGVRCKPPANATGSQTGTVTFTSDTDPTGAKSTSTLSCSVGTPNIVVVTTSLAFGDVLVNPSPAPSMPVTISNTGTSTLTFTASSPSSVYTLGGCSSACNVAPGASAQFTVTFAPTAPGDVNVNLTVASNDPDTPSVTIPVTGRGIAPQISSPTPLAFGDVEVGKTSGSQDLTVTNTGTSTLTISGASISSGAADYTVMSGTTGSQMTAVPAGGSVSWTLVCNPTAQGSRPGTFQILSNSYTQSTLSVPLSCNGTRGNLVVSVSGGGTTLNFGSVVQGSTTTRTFTLTNTGNLPVNNIAAVVNPATVGYSIDPAGNPVPTSLAAGASVTLTVKLVATNATDGGNATITFTGDWGTTPTTTTAVLSLTSTVLSAGYTLTTNTLDFGNLRYDATLDKTFCIVNNSQATLQIVTPLAITPAAGTVTNEFSVVHIRRQTTCGGNNTTDVSLPQTLTAGQILEITVRADPANRAGMMQATLTVNSDLPANPTRTLTLLGNSTTGMFSLTPGALVDFGPVDVQATTPATKTITITNTGDGALDLSGFTRTANAHFTFTLPGTTTLQPTQSLSIVVTYKPTVAAPAGSEESITISHAIGGDVDGPTSQTIAIRGRGIDRKLDLAATPTFPDTFKNPGDQAPIRTARIQNLGEATLQLKAVMVTNDTDVWQLVNPDPVDLPYNGTYEFQIRFVPKVAGPAPAAKLQITHDDDMYVMKPIVSINLTGNGLDRGVVFGSGAIHLGYTGVGVPVTIDGALIVANGDPKNTFTVRDIALDEGSPFTIEGLSPNLELTPLAEQRFAVTFTPTAEGQFSATARLYLDMDPQAQREITIDGTAVFVDAHGGGGCAAGGSGGPAGGSVLALAALAGLRRRRRRALAGAAAAVAAAAIALAPAAAAADDIALSIFDPVPATTSNGFQLQSPDVGASGDWVASAVLSHATDPLILDGFSDGKLVNDYAVISRSTVMNVGAAVAFLGRFEAGARMPLYMQDGQPAGDPMQGFTSRPAQGNARGDLALHAKVRFLKARLEGDGAFSLGLGAQLTLPTATRDQFAGTEDPSGKVQLLGALTPGAFERRVALTMNIGAVLRSRATYANLEQKSGAAWGLGASVRALDWMWIDGEVYGDTVPAGRTDEMTRSRVLSPIEWLGGLRLRPDRKYTIGLAAGRGLTSAVGTPAFRGVVSLTVTPGAPELRPIRPPRIDGDADGDGVPDSADRCPNEPEDKDLYDDSDGCPDPDNDNDGVPDAKDKCPLDAEDRDGYADDDGCPDKDNDGDGIPDAKDKCPMQAEDADGFSDTDGCPDDDNDRDGIPDAKDKCPNQPETINGNQDDDGCPDKGDSLVVLSPDRLETLDQIQFAPNQKIAKASNGLLAQIGATLRARTEIARLRITVHVQPTSDSDRDQEISDKRAAAIRDWLVQWGIAPARLEARGFGGTKPLVPADGKGATALNTRVELIILERK